MFIIGGNQAVCPRGFICVNNYNLLVILLVIIIGIYFMNKQVYLTLYNKMLQERVDEEKNKESELLTTNPPVIDVGNNTNYSYNTQQKGAIIEMPFNNSTRNNFANNQNNQNNQNYSNQMVDMDRVMLNDRLYPPLSRNHYQDPNGIMPIVNSNGKAVMPINIETRGSGGDFQQVGILSKNDIQEDEKTPGNNTDSNILPLYGKPTYRGSNKWLYYTETDKLNPIKIPITVNNKDCTDDQGCDELYDGGQVNIPSYNGVFNVKIYKFNKPRYIPLDNPREVLPLPFT